MSDLPLTAGELASMRTTANTLGLPGTAYLLTPTLASDGQGGQTATWGTAGTVSARFAFHKDGAEVNVGDRLSKVAGWIVTVPAFTTVAATTRIKEAGSGTEYEVIETLPFPAHEVSRRVRVREVT